MCPLCVFRVVLGQKTQKRLSASNVLLTCSALLLCGLLLDMSCSVHAEVLLVVRLTLRVTIQGQTHDRLCEVLTAPLKVLSAHSIIFWRMGLLAI